MSIQRWLKEKGKLGAKRVTLLGHIGQLYAQFISTGGFTTDAKNTAAGSQVHVELVDLSRFIRLWQEFYNEMTDEDKSLLSLHPVYFLAQQS